MWDGLALPAVFSFWEFRAYSIFGAFGKTFLEKVYEENDRKTLLGTHIVGKISKVSL